MNLFKELKRRKVLKNLGVYGAAAMVITTTAATLFPFLLIPDWMVRFIIVLAILGIPITFFLSWTYDLKRDAQADDQSENADVIKDKKWSLTKKILFPVSGFILMTVGGIFWFIYPFLTLSLGDVREYDTSIAILYPERDTHPDFFYYRDIIKAYESSQIQ